MPVAAFPLMLSNNNIFDCLHLPDFYDYYSY